MESALGLRCNTFPLLTPSSFHAANLRSSFRRSDFSTGKGFRSYKARPILGPITSAVGPSRHNRANDHRLAFSMACVIGIVGCSFWLKQEVIAAPQVEKGSSQMESTGQEVLSKKPTKRRVTEQVGSESKTNKNLQMPSSEAPVSPPQVVDKVEDLPQSDFVPQQFRGSSSSVSGESLVSEHEAEKHPKPELQRKASNVKIQRVVGKVEDWLQSHLVPQRGSSTFCQECLLPEDEGKKHVKPELHGKAVHSTVKETVDKVEDWIQSQLDPEHAPSTIDQETSLSEDGAEKPLKPESPGKAIDETIKEAAEKVEDWLQLQLMPQQAASIITQESLLPEDRAEKDIEPELQRQTSDVKLSQVVAEAEDFPQPQSVSQQASSTVTHKSSLAETQEEFQGKSSDVKVNPIGGGCHFSPSQVPQIDSGVGAVAPSNINYLASPLVSILFRINPSTMPSLVFVSPPTKMPVEPRPGISKSDREDEKTKVLVRGVPVSPSIAAEVEKIFAEHGDITANCLLKDQLFRGELIEGLVTVMRVMQKQQAGKMTYDDFTFMYRKLKDLESVKMNVGWLREQIEVLQPFLNLEDARSKWETMEAEVKRMGARLAEQEAKLANQEKELAQKHEQGAMEAGVERMGPRLAGQEAKLANQEKELAQKRADKAESEKQGTMEAEVERTGARLVEQVAKLANQEKELTQKHADKAESEKQGTMEAEVERTGARLAEQEAKLANQEKELAHKDADKAKSEKQGMMEIEVERMGARWAEQETKLANQEKELAQKRADIAKSEKQGMMEAGVDRIGARLAGQEAKLANQEKELARKHADKAESEKQGTMEAEVERTGAKLAEQEAKLANQEKELAQKHADKAKSEKQGMMETEVERMGASLAGQEEKLANQEKELARKHADKVESEKQRMMEAEVERMGARLSEQEAKLANKEKELAQMHADKVKSEKQRMMEAEVERMRAILVEQEAKLANKEKELAQMHADKAKSEKQRMMEAEVERMGARLAEQEAKLANKEKELTQMHADKAKSEKQGTMEAEVERMGARLAEQEAKLANQEKELAQKRADKAESEKEGTQELKKEDKPVGAWPLYYLGTLLQGFGLCSIFYVLLQPK